MRSFAPTLSRGSELAAPRDRSLTPSSTIACVRPGCMSTSRSKRASAAGPVIGESTPFPEMPALTTALAGSFDASSRRASTSGQRLLEAADGRAHESRDPGPDDVADAEELGGDLRADGGPVERRGEDLLRRVLPKPEHA